MQKRSPIELDSEVLPDRQAARLLERASEMDVARTAGSSVADLRAAAAEAGISAHSFDAALAEMQRDANSVVPLAQARPRGRFWKWSFAALSLTLIAAMVIVPRLFPATGAAVPAASMVEEAILLRCLTPGEAAVLIRPAIRDNAATIVARPEQAPRVITIRATAEQLQSVRAILDKYEGAGASCASRPTPPVTP